jgi:hypothetical protein
VGVELIGKVSDVGSADQMFEQYITVKRKHGVFVAGVDVRRQHVHGVLHGKQIVSKGEGRLYNGSVLLATTVSSLVEVEHAR